MPCDIVVCECFARDKLQHEEHVSDTHHDLAKRMAAFGGDVARGKIEAGQSTGLVDRLMPAAEVVAEIARDYATCQ